MAKTSGAAIVQFKLVYCRLSARLFTANTEWFLTEVHRITRINHKRSVSCRCHWDKVSSIFPPEDWTPMREYLHDMKDEISRMVGVVFVRVRQITRPSIVPPVIIG